MAYSSLLDNRQVSPVRFAALCGVRKVLFHVLLMCPSRVLYLIFCYSKFHFFIVVLESSMVFAYLN